MTTINRNKFLQALSVCRPALASQAFVPAYTHFLFTKGWVTAFNDLLGISVVLEHELAGCLPGDLLIKGLQSMTAGDVLVDPVPGKAAVLVQCGRAKLTLPTLPTDDFPVKWPNTKDTQFIAVTEEMLKGIAACLPGVGTNNNQPAQMGVTLEQGAKGPVLWATDGNTMSQYVCDPDKGFTLPGEVPVIMPTQFCEQVLAVAKTLPKADMDIAVLPGMLLLEALDGDNVVARVMCRTLVDVQPLDFGAVKAKHTKSAPDLAEMPAGWEEALQRALVVTANEVDKVLTLSASRKSLRMQATAATGDSEDTLDFSGELPEEKVALDPVLVLRGSKLTDKMAFGATALLMSGRDGKFFHMIAHYAR